MKKFFVTLQICSFALGLGILTGCGGSSSTGNSSLPDPALRFFNASVDAGNLDFYLNDDKIAPNLAYLGSSADFQTIPFKGDEEGGYDVAVTPAGSADELDRIQKTFDRDKSFLTVALGLANPGSELQKRLRILNIDVDRHAPIGNKTNLIIVHGGVLSPGNDTPPVDFQTQGANPNFPVDNPKFKKTIQFANTGADDNKILTVDSGLVTYLVRRSDAGGQSSYIVQPANLAPGKLYLALISGVLDLAGSAPNGPRLTFIELQTRN